MPPCLAHKRVGVKYTIEGKLVYNDGYPYYGLHGDMKPGGVGHQCTTAL